MKTSNIHVISSFAQKSTKTFAYLMLLTEQTIEQLIITLYNGIITTLIGFKVLGKNQWTNCVVFQCTPKYYFIEVILRPKNKTVIHQNKILLNDHNLSGGSLVSSVLSLFSIYELSL